MKKKTIKITYQELSQKSVQTRTAQVKFGDSYFTDNVCESLSEFIPELSKGSLGTMFSEQDVKNIFSGEKKEIVYHPASITAKGFSPCKSYKSGNETIYENNITLSLEGDVVQIKSSMNYGKYKAKIRFVTYEIEENDVCFAVIGSKYGRGPYETTKDEFCHELFDTAKEAEDFLNETQDGALSYYDAYEVEVFSRTHIVQMDWYKRSMDALFRDDDLEK